MLVAMRCPNQLALTAQFRDAGGFKIEKLKYKTMEIPRKLRAFRFVHSVSLSVILFYIIS